MFESIVRRWSRHGTSLAALDAEESALLVGGAVTLAGTSASFLVAPSLTAYWFVAFAAILAYGAYAHQGKTAKGMTFVATVSTVLILGLITGYLLVQSIPVFRYMGVETLYADGDYWSTSQGRYSLTPAIWGTFLSTLLATAIAGPLGIAAAVFISEIAPPWSRDVTKPAVETLAGIPSIVYGFIGFVILNGYMQDQFELPTNGSIVVVGLVVGLMALPTVASVAEDAISSVPDHVKDGAIAMGATEWQTIRSVTLPASFSGVSAAVLLGVGRTVGETMAATVILGNVMELPEPLYDVFGNTVTLTSLIASQYGNAHGTHMQALFAAGVVLFATVLLLSVGAQLIETHMNRKFGGEL
ncbi:MAG: phosphate ABC transporter permease subunit PstC [Halolamina sp.]